MKLFISTYLFYPSRLGGPANTLYWLAKALVNNGGKVSVVTTDRHIEHGRVETNIWCDVEGIRVRYCSAQRTLLIKECWYSLREMKYCDTVMLCDLFQLQVLPVAFIAKLFGKKIIWSPRGELHSPALAGNKLKKWYIGIIRRCFGTYAIFHATSEEEKSLILSHMGKKTKVVVIPNYIELPEQQVRKEQTIPYFLYVGRINSIKALDRLILGIAQSRLFKQLGYILKIAGPNQDNYQQVLEKMVGENGLQGKVEFVGNVFGKEKFQLYANAHFSCLLSHSENFGNVVIEALSQGTPVIASTGTPWEVLNEAKAGYWIDNSPESIAKYIDKALEMSESGYTVMRHNALELAKSFDVSKNISKWIETL